jgi:RNA polymerase sigma factor (sigma-70 family)
MAESAEMLASLHAIGMLSPMQREELGKVLLAMSYKAVWAAVYSHHASFCDADDLVGDTVMAAWRGLPRYDCNRGTLATWVGRVAKSRIADYYRRRARERIVIEQLSGKLVDLTTLEPPPDIAACADALYEWDEQLGRWMHDVPSDAPAGTIISHVPVSQIEYLAREIGKRYNLPCASFSINRDI